MDIETFKGFLNRKIGCEAFLSKILQDFTAFLGAEESLNRMV